MSSTDAAYISADVPPVSFRAVAHPGCSYRILGYQRRTPAFARYDDYMPFLCLYMRMINAYQ